MFMYYAECPPSLSPLTMSAFRSSRNLEGGQHPFKPIVTSSPPQQGGTLGCKKISIQVYGDTNIFFIIRGLNH